MRYFPPYCSGFSETPESQSSRAGARARRRASRRVGGFRKEKNYLLPPMSLANSDTKKLVEACRTGDRKAIHAAGWSAFYDDLRDWWRRRFALEDLAPYVDVLDGEDPDTAHRALWTLRTEEWRPAPSGVLHRIHELREPEPSPQPGAIADASYQSPASLARVRQLLARGDPICECVPRPMHWLLEEIDGRIWQEADHRRHRGRLPDHVIRCGQCRGIEPGQAYEAEDEPWR